MMHGQKNIRWYHCFVSKRRTPNHPGMRRHISDEHRWENLKVLSSKEVHNTWSA